jgi:hypothetical protein
MSIRNAIFPRVLSFLNLLRLSVLFFCLVASSLEANASYLPTTGSNIGIGTSTPVGGLVIMNGNVGIGTWSPTEKLEVAGDVNIIGGGGLFTQGAITAGNSLVAQQGTSLEGALSVDGLAVFNANIGVGTSANAAALSVMNGNVGIGTWSPTSRLQVVGTVAATAFTGDGSGLTGVTSNSGWTDDGTVVRLTTGSDRVGIGTTLNSDGTGLAVMNGNVGINTWSPDGRLHIKGDGSGLVPLIIDQQRNVSPSVFGEIYFKRDSGGTSYTMGNVVSGTSFGITDSHNNNVLLIDNSGAIGIGTTTPVGGTSIMNGNVGIGTWNPAAPLDVIGEIHSSADIYAGDFGSFHARGVTVNGNSGIITGADLVGGGPNGLGYYIKSDDGQTTYYATIRDDQTNEIARFTNSDNVGIGTVNPTSRLVVAGGGIGVGTSRNSSFITATAPSGGLMVEGRVAIGTTTPVAGLTVMNGNVGIGTWSPTSRLQVVGTVAATAFTGDGSGLTGVTSNSGWTDDGTVVRLTTGTDNVGIGTVSPRGALTVISGNVGIGTANPRALLELSDGSAGATFNAAAGSLNVTAPGSITIDPEFNVNIATGTVGSPDSVLIGRSDTNITTTVRGLTSLTNNAGLQGLYQDASANVGIGTVFPVGGLTVMKGNVGIGTWSPGAPLMVRKGTGSATAIDANAGLVLDSNADNYLQLTTAATKSMGLLFNNTSNALMFDSNTGIMQINTNGQGRLQIDANGFFGIGTNQQGVARLAMSHDFTTDAFAIGDTRWDTFRIKATGNTGIGTSDPRSRLVVNGGVGIGTTSLSPFVDTAAPAGGLLVEKNVGIGTTTPGGGLIVMNGNVGIGTWSPVYALDVKGIINTDNQILSSSIINGAKFQDSSSGGTNYFVDPWPNPAGNAAILGGNVGIGTTTPVGALTVMNGNVGIGTWSPTARLQVVGTVNATAFVGDGSGLTNVTGANSGWTDGGTNVYTTTTTDNVAIGTTTPSSTLEIVKTAAGTAPLMVSSTATADGNYLIVSSSGNIGMGTTTSVGALTVMNGSVGIGTWSPRAGLEVKTEAGVLFTAPGDCSGGFQLGDGANGQYGTIAQTCNGDNSMTFQTNYSAGINNALIFSPAAAEAMRIMQGARVGIGTTTPVAGLAVMSGNVGIGTWSPTQRLQVVGTVAATAFSGDGSALTNLPSSGGWTDGGTNVYETTTTDIVGIGTTTPTGTLEIVKQGSTIPLMVSSVPTGDGDYLTVTSGGNVGIGTTAPFTAKMTVASSTTASGIESLATAALGPSSGGGIAVRTSLIPTAADQRLGGFFFGASDGVTQYSSAGIFAYSQESFAGGRGSYFTFETVPTAATSRTVKMRIDANGNIGIGTNQTPQATLEVSSTAAQDIFRVNDNGYNDSSPSILVDQNGNVGIGTTVIPQAALAVFTGNVGIGTATAVAGTAIMNGSVGIGTWSPNGDLEIMSTRTGSGYTNQHLVLRTLSSTTGDASSLGFSVTNGGTPEIGAKIQHYRTGSESQGGLAFYTKPNTTVGTDTSVEQMRLDQNGNLGIGTTTPVGGLTVMTGNVGIGTWKPQQALDVSGLLRVARNSSSFTMTMGNPIEDDTAQIVINGEASGYGFGVSNGNFNITHSGRVGIGTSSIAAGLTVMTGNVGIGTWSVNGGVSGALIVDNNAGNVGIGTIRPGTKLDVNGTVRATAFVGDGSGLTNVANSAGWTDGGTNVYTTTTTDNVGIGTTTPSTTFEIVKQSSQKPLMISSVPTGDGDYFVIKSDGNVGIGTTEPMTALNIGSTTDTINPKRIYLSDWNSSTGYPLYIGNWYSDNTWGIGSVAAAHDNTLRIGIVSFPSLSWAADQSPFILSVGGSIGIGTTTPVGGLSVMSGNVGIGTWSPTARLQVIGTVNATAFVGDGSGLTNVANSAGWTDGGTNIYETTTTDVVGIGTTTPNAATLEIMKQGSTAPFKISSVATGNGDYLVVKSFGSVGIGTISPSNRLDVNGNGYFANNVNVNSVLMLGGANFASQSLSAFLVGDSAGNTLPLYLYTNGAERMRIDNSGNVGIGTTLTTTNGLSVMNGSVGIGTWSPGLVTLYAKGTYGVTSESSANGAGFLALNTSPNGGYGGQYGGRLLLGEDDGSHMIATGALGTVGFSGVRDTSHNLTTGADIIGSADAVWTGASTPGALHFRTAIAGDVGNLLERMTIDSTGNIGLGTTAPVGGLTIMNGNVGIGTWSPRDALEIRTGVNTTQIDGTGGVFGGSVVASQFSANSPNGVSSFWGVGLGTTMNSPATGLAIINGNVGIGTWIVDGASGVLVTTAATGNVGFGTIRPGARLDVNGTVRATAFVGDGSGLTNVANSAGWTDGGTNVYTTTTTDNVAIGTTTPVNRLSIQGNVGIGTTAAYKNIAAPVNGLVVEGNVGIGTWAPDAQLELVKLGSQPPLMISSTGSGNGDYMIINSAGNVGLGTVVASFKLAFPSAGSTIGVQSNGTNTGGDLTVSAGDSAGGTDKSGGNLNFYSGKASGTGQSYITFNAPAAQTQSNAVANTTTQVLQMNGNSLGVTFGASLMFNGTTTSLGDTYMTSGTAFEFWHDSFNNVLHMESAPSGTANTAITFTDAIVLTGSGNVGMGTFKPVDLLSIMGNVGIGTTAAFRRIGGPQDGLIVERNVGIGTWAPDAQLEITKLGNQAPLMVSSVGSGNGDYLKIDSAGNTGIGTITPVGGLTVMNGNVGIGTWSPEYALDVVPYSGIRVRGNNIAITLATPSGTTQGFIETPASGVSLRGGSAENYIHANASGVGVGTTTPVTGFVVMNGNVGIGTWSTSGVSGALIVANNAGNVGIGTIRPGTKLDVNGTVRATAFVGDGSGLTNLPGGASGWTDGGTNVFTSTTTDNVAIGTTTPSGTLEIVKTAAGTAPLMVSSTATADGNYLIVSSAGNVGIGTTLAAAGTGLTVMNGNMGIGTWVTSQKLTINGSIAFGPLDNQPVGIEGRSSIIDFKLWDNYAAILTQNGGNALAVASNMNLGWSSIALGSGPMGQPDTYFARAAAGSITTPGNLGIGTTLTVGGLAVMNGNVGIGTWSPTAAFELVGNHATGIGLARFKSTGGTAQLTLDTTGSGDTAIRLLDNGATVGGLGSVHATGNLSLLDSTLNSERLSVTPSGNVGIGTTTPVAGLAVMNGNVGIGTWSPTAKLQVVGTVNATAFVGDGSGLTGAGSGGWTDGGTNVFTSTTTDNVAIGTTTPSATLEVVKTAAGTAPFMVSSTATKDGDLFIVTSDGRIGIGTTLTSTAGVTFNSGFVGIGTWSPRETLEVSGNSAGGAGYVRMAINNPTVGSNGTSFRYYNGNTLGAAIVYNNVDGQFELNAQAAGSYTTMQTASVERLRISSTGNIGIGTTAPVGALTVMNGNVGIGTWSPVQALEVKGTAIASNGVGVGFPTATTNFVTVAGDGGMDSGSSGAKIVLATGGGNTGNITFDTSVSNGTDKNIVFTAGGGVGIGTTMLPAKGLSVMNGNVGIGTWSPNGRLSIVGNVGVGTIGASPFVTIAPPSGGMQIEGNVGIGTWDPYTTLSLRGNYSASFGDLLITSSNSDAAALAFKTRPVASSSNSRTWMIQTNVPDSGSLGIYRGVTLTDNPTTLAMALDLNGNMGIGTSMPVGGLSVMNGNMGIGTWSPGLRLNVVGNVGVGTIGTSAYLNTLPVRAGSFQVEGGVGIGTTLTSASSGLVIMNGNVGLGTWNPRARLEINNTLSYKSIFDNGNSGAAITIDWRNANIQKVTMNNACTFTFTAPAGGIAKLVLELIQDGTGSRTATWPATVKWPGASAPTLTTAASSVDFVSCLYDGTNYYCTDNLDFR